ncbi:MAG: hypothetical protein J5910_07885 [Lachnospiraceae bacterium]|nr:hypothetical protein [Lachnospiraceae bacterium]
MRYLRTILSVSLAMSLMFGTAVYASEDNIPDISDEQMIEVTETDDEPSVIIPDESDDDAASVTDTAGSSDVIVDYTHTDGPVYLMVGESWWYLSFENSRYDDNFQGKRTQKPKYSQSGVLSYSKKKDKDGVTKLHFKGVKPGTTELSFIVTHKGGSYETAKDTFVVFKPFLTKTKFDDITSLNTVINMQDYIDGLESGYTRDIYELGFFKEICCRS